MSDRPPLKPVVGPHAPAAPPPGMAAHPGRAGLGARAAYGAVLLAGLLVAVVLLVRQLDTLVIAAMVTVILSLPLSWCAERLERRGVPRALGALIGLLVALGVVVGGLAFLLPQLIAEGQRLIAATPATVHTIELKVSGVTGVRPGRLANQLQNDAQTLVRNPSHLAGPIATIGFSAAEVVGAIVIAVITAYFIAARPGPLRDGILSLFPQARRADAQRTLQRIATAWAGWLRGVGISMLLIGVMLYLALELVVGLPFALVFSVFSGVAEVVPYLGALVSGVPPVAFALTLSPTKALVVLAIYIAVHQVEANLIGPLVMSRAVHLHPAVIAFGVIAVGEVFGFFGLIIAVPILSLVGILIDELWVRPRRAPAIPRPPDR